MEINYDDALNQDSLFLLDLCPVQAFPENSAEQNFSQKWLDHLCTYQVENLDDRRLRNIYISHLCTALIQRQLYGPFIKDPPKGKLEKIDFHSSAVCPNATLMQAQEPNAHSTLQHPMGDDLNLNMTRNTSQINICTPQHSSYTVVNATKTINSTGIESQGHISVGSTNLSFNITSGSPGPSTSCSCPPKPCACTKSGSPCNCNRSTAGADLKHPDEEEAICNYLMHQLNITPDFLNDFDATLTSFMDLCKVASLEAKTQSQTQTNSRSQLSLQTPAKYYYLPKNPSSSIQENELENSSKLHISEARSNSPSPTDYEEMREDINELLEAISSELRGDSEPGSNDFLDRELARYKNFLMKQNHLEGHFRLLTSEHKLRNCLLLRLQNDLIKLLNDAKI